MGKLLRFRGITKLDLDPQVMLEAIAEERPKLTSVFVMGFTEDGDTFFASSKADGGDLMWLMEVCKRRLLDMVED